MKKKNRQHIISLLAVSLAACSNESRMAATPPLPPARPQASVDEPPTALEMTSHVFEVCLIADSCVSIDVLSEANNGAWVAGFDEDWRLATKLAEIKLTDDGQGDNQLVLSNAEFVELRPTDDRLIWELWLKENPGFNYETAPVHQVEISVSTNQVLVQRLLIELADRNDPPSAVILSEIATTLDEGTHVARKLADISFVDEDRLAKNQDNQAHLNTHPLFELRNRNSELWLKEGAVLDYETAQSHRAVISATPTIAQTARRLTNGEWPDDISFASAVFTLKVSDVDESLVGSSAEIL